MRIELAVAASLATIIIGQSAHGQGFDGRWQGTYSCGAHVSLPLGPFTWSLQVDVQNGAITSRHDYRISTRGNIPATANFNGNIDPSGNAHIGVIAADANSVDNYHQTLVGKVVSPTRIQLSGPMLGRDGKPVRNCSLALNLIAPPQPVVSAQDTDQERQRLEAQRQAATAREQKAIERQKAAEAARAQAEEEQRKALEAQQAATGQANQDKQAALEAQKKADAERQVAEAALRDAETMKQQALAELRAAQAQKEAADAKIKAAQEQRQTAMRADLVDLPKDEQEQWLQWYDKIPVQELEFCRVIRNYENDKKKLERVSNDIKTNELMKQFRQDLNSLFHGGDIDAWVARVVEVKQAEEGSVAIILKTPCNAFIGSYLGSDCKHPANFEGTISENSPIYNELAKFERADFALIGGNMPATKVPEVKSVTQYKLFFPDQFCADEKADVLFVSNLKSIFKLVPSSNN